MKASDILRLAREVLERIPVTHTWEGICYALHVAADANIQRMPVAAHDRAQARIYELLGSHAYLQNWLVANGHIDSLEIRTEEGAAMLRATRLAWIDDLIAYFEEQGD